jgi:hypothetical protein
MFVNQNKFLLLGTLAVAAVFLAVHFMWVQDNWTAAAAKLDEAEKSRTEWEKNFQMGENKLAKVDAEKAIEENNRSLKAGFAALQLIEFGTKESLQPFSEAAAGTGDRKNFVMTKRTTVYNHAKSMNVLCSSELGLTDKIAEEPVALNLLRIAIIDNFFNACNRAKVGRVTRIQYYPSKLMPFGDEAGADDADEKKPAKGKNDKEAAAHERNDRLIQFPVKVQVVAAEPAINKLLSEIQKPTAGVRGYLCLRGFHISVRQAGSGTVEAVLGFTALLNEKTVRELGIAVKEDETRHGGTGPTAPKVDLNRY